MNKNINSILAAEDGEQIDLGLRDTLTHLRCRPHTKQILGAWKTEEAKVGKLAVHNLRAMADHVATTKNKGMLTKSCRTVLSFISMTVTKGGEEDGVLVNAICWQIFPPYSEGTSKLIMKKAYIKRKRFDEEDLSQFNIVDKEKKDGSSMMMQSKSYEAVWLTIFSQGSLQ